MQLARLILITKQVLLVLDRIGRGLKCCLAAHFCVQRGPEKMSEPTSDTLHCASRLKQLLASWSRNETMWHGATGILIGTGVNTEDDLRYLKSVALELWLFGYELPDTLMLFTKTEIHVVTGGKKGSFSFRARAALFTSAYFFSFCTFL